MRRAILLAAALAAFLVSTVNAVPVAPERSNGAAAVVVLVTLKGEIEIETYPADAPKSVARFVDLAKRGHYRGTRFHWVQPGIVQVGDLLSRDMTKRADWGRGGSGPLNSLRPIGVAETSKRKFERGIVGLAYQGRQKPEEADCQIFILKAPNPALEGKYAAIGHVIKGMGVVDKIVVEDRIKDVLVR